MMTRRQMLEVCIDDQITRGIIPAEQREFQINARLKGHGAMSWSEVKTWWNQVEYRKEIGA